MLNHMHILRERVGKAGQQFCIEENNSVYIPHTSHSPSDVGHSRITFVSKCLFRFLYPACLYT